MKKIFLCVICFCMLFSLFAQEGETYKVNEFQGKLGMVPYFETVYSSLVGMYNTKPFIPLPVVTLEYLHYLNSKNALGTSFSIGAPLVSFSSDDWNAFHAGLRFTYRRIYFAKEKIKLFGEIGLGAELFYMTGDSEKFQPWFSACVSPLGLWFGSDNLFGTAELAFGSEGSLLTLGLGKRF